MSNLKVNTINDASGGSAAVLYGVASPPNSMGFRNRIINGDMRIDQRNAGASVAVATTVFGYLTVDRWRVNNQTDGALTLQQSSVAPAGFNSSLLATITTADASLGAAQYCFLQQYIEGFNVGDLAFGSASASPITVSFWVRSSVTGTFGGAITNGAVNRSYPFNYTISAANTWEQKTVTLSGDTTGTWATNNTAGMSVFFSLGTGTDNSGTANAWAGAQRFSATGATNLVGTNGATFYVTGVQLEAGTVASQFERRDYGRELMMCQRYYWKGEAGGAGGVAHMYSGPSIASDSLGPYIFTPVMRVSPTMSILVAPTYNSCSSFDVVATVGGGAMHRLTPSVSSAYRAYGGTYGASAEL